MNELKIFENKEFGQVRTVIIDGEPWFVGKDVAVALGYKNTKDALLNHVDDEDRRILQRSEIATLENNLPKETFPVEFASADIPNRGLTVINESGVYSLIFGSKLPSAKKFKHWVTSEVLPSIRKTGAYVGIGQVRDERLVEFMDEQSKTSRFQQELIMEVTERLERLEKSKAEQDRDSEVLIPVRSMTFQDRMKKLNDVVSSLAGFYGVERKTALHKFYDGLNAELDVNLNTFLTAYRAETGNEDSCPLHAIAYYERIFSRAMALSFDTVKLDRIFNGVA